MSSKKEKIEKSLGSIGYLLTLAGDQNKPGLLAELTLLKCVKRLTNSDIERLKRIETYLNKNVQSQIIQSQIMQRQIDQRQV